MTFTPLRRQLPPKVVGPTPSGAQRSPRDGPVPPSFAGTTDLVSARHATNVALVECSLASDDYHRIRRLIEAERRIADGAS